MVIGWSDQTRFLSQIWQVSRTLTPKSRTGHARSAARQLVVNFWFSKDAEVGQCAASATFADLVYIRLFRVKSCPVLFHKNL